MTESSLAVGWSRLTQSIRGPGVALGLVTPLARAARAALTVLRGASRGSAAVLVTRLRR